MTVEHDAPKADACADFDVNDDVKALFTPVKFGRMQLQHRIVMAPLTRCRAPKSIPTQVMATYYGQRATPGGLIVSEATIISEQARGTPNTPGIYSAEQVEAWKPVVQAVHNKGGLFVCQLWHQGRASHPDFQPDGAVPMGPSAIPVSDMWPVTNSHWGDTDDVQRSWPTPRTLETSEIPGIMQQYVDAAKNAIAAGFDGVEVHAANGYLLDQFLKDSSNHRTDEYGGSNENKARLILEVVAAVAAAVGADRTGIRLNPYNSYLDAKDSLKQAVDKNVWLLQELEHRVPDLAYVSLVEPLVANATIWNSLKNFWRLGASLAPFREATSLPFLAAGGHSRASGIKYISSGAADAVAFGRHFIANPDLVKRFAQNAALNKYNRMTFYSSGPEGYTDYPFLE